MTDFHTWDDVRAELFEGDDQSARTEARVSACHLAEERKRLRLTWRQIAGLMG